MSSWCGDTKESEVGAETTRAEGLGEPSKLWDNKFRVFMAGKAQASKAVGATSCLGEAGRSSGVKRGSCFS